MIPTQEVIKLAQKSLNKHYKQRLKVDGLAGRRTRAALLEITVLSTHWPLERQIFGYIQHACSLEKIDAGPIDGYWGPQTEQGYEELHLRLNGHPVHPWRDDEGLGGVPDADSPWPIQTQEELIKFYGPVGQNQTKIKVPYPLKIA